MNPIPPKDSFKDSFRKYIDKDEFLKQESGRIGFGCALMFGMLGAKISKELELAEKKKKNCKR